MKRFLTLMAFAAAIFAGTAANARASDQTALIADAANTLHHMRSDDSFGPSRDLLRQARAVLIVPNLVKGGFFFGGEGGNGILMRHDGARWSNPAFYTLASGSFGLQIGLEKAELVMFIMSQKALDGLQRAKFKLGAGAGLTVITVGANAQGATAPNLSGDIIVWSATKGAYGGLTLEGSIVDPKRDWNDAFYGKPTPIGAILSDTTSRPDTAELRDALMTARKAAAR